MRAVFLIALLTVWPVLVSANDKLVRLAATEGLIESGLLGHILPRFTLKTQVRVEVTDNIQDADLVFGPVGPALFQSADDVWHMDIRSPDHRGTRRFADWLNSEIGQRTIYGYAPEGVALFSPPLTRSVEVAAVTLEGDAELGLEISRTQCARCHAINEAGRKNDIGSSPSFYVLRSLPDWQERFEAFYVLNPHPSFTQIADVTEPFPADRPSPIVPVELTLEDLDAVLAYVSALAAADLGSPLVHQ